MSEHPRERIAWLRLTAEGVAIVLSILLAFGIDAWAERARTEADQRVFLTSLEGEIARAIHELDTARAYQETVVEAARRWRSVTVDDHPDTIAALIDRSTHFASPRISLASAEALLSAGLIADVADPEVRNWISVWPRQQERLRTALDPVVSFATVELFRYFASKGWSYASVVSDLATDSVSTPIGADPALMRRVATDPGLRTLFVQGQRMSAIYIWEADEVRAFLVEGLDLVRGALDR